MFRNSKNRSFEFRTIGHFERGHITDLYMTTRTALGLVNPAPNRSKFEAIYFEFRTIRPFDLRTDRFEFRSLGSTECEIGGGRSRSRRTRSPAAACFRFRHARIPEVPPDRRRYADFSDTLIIRGVAIEDDACGNRATFELKTSKVETSSDGSKPERSLFSKHRSRSEKGGIGR